ncbi:hypothetical protein FE840_017845 (plasmid) [Peteryoungia desertarenae]|uniref:Uncharacterized protein n=1 Tax=Peteryoungia desertarenae TaxID=1813451 RepID=A0ABX6QSP3_9HYPH|nr:hypothetical protein [Peteryoungia desertarenae]QLF71457.1 hypothetical protein FE840_017845 [Peteryoungia desertarenae]
MNDLTLARGLVNGRDQFDGFFSLAKRWQVKVTATIEMLMDVTELPCETGSVLDVLDGCEEASARIRHAGFESRCCAIIAMTSGSALDPPEDGSACKRVCDERGRDLRLRVNRQTTVHTPLSRSANFRKGLSAGNKFAQKR